MRITVLGGTGPTGQQIVTKALSRGYDVTVLVRDPERLTEAGPRLEVFVGDATSVDDLSKAISGSSAVLSALGSGSARKSDIASRAATALVTAADLAGVPRVIWLSALGVGSSKADGSGIQRLIWKTMMADVFADKAIADGVLADSDLRYTLVYPTTLTNKAGTEYTASAHLQAKGMPTISRAAVAQFMLDELGSNAWVRSTAQLKS
jgi:putative NADH-flavin reductase